METGNRQRLKNILWNTLKAFVTIASLYIVFQIIHPRDLAAAFASADMRLIAAALLLLSVNLVVRGIKWRLLVSTVEEHTGFHTAFGSVLFGISLASVTPGGLGEFVGRVSSIESERRMHIAGLTLLDRLQNLLVVMALGGSGVACLYVENFLWAGVACLVVAAAAAYLFYNLNVLQSLADRIPFLRKPWIADVFEAFGLLTRREMTRALLFSLLYYLSILFQIFFLINAFSPVSFVGVLWGYSAVLFIKSFIPISLGDLGIREMGMVFFFSTLGVPAWASVNASLLIFVINVVIPASFGILYAPGLWRKSPGPGPSA